MGLYKFNLWKLQRLSHNNNLEIPLEWLGSLTFSNAERFGLILRPAICPLQNKGWSKDFRDSARVNRSAGWKLWGFTRLVFCFFFFLLAKMVGAVFLLFISDQPRSASPKKNRHGRHFRTAFKFKAKLV